MGLLVHRVVEFLVAQIMYDQSHRNLVCIVYVMCIPLYLLWEEIEMGGLVLVWLEAKKLSIVIVLAISTMACEGVRSISLISKKFQR